MTHLHKQHGLTLIELLVSITIGIFIIGAALFTFQGVASVGRQVNEVTQLRQQGTTAFRLIGKQIREAGDLQPPFVSDNHNYRFKDTYEWSGQTASIGPWSNPPTGVTKYLNVVQQIPSAGTATYLKNCLGTDVATNRRSTFYLQNGSLMCNQQPIIHGVHDMVIRYRVDVGANSKQFLDATAAINWSKVDAVEVCLDLVGAKHTPDGGNEYENCEGVESPRNNKLHFVQKTLFKINPGGQP